MMNDGDDDNEDDDEDDNGQMHVRGKREQDMESQWEKGGCGQLMETIHHNKDISAGTKRIKKKSNQTKEGKKRE